MKNLTDLSADYMSGQIDRADMERGSGRPEVRKSLFRRLYRIIYGRCRGESNDIMTVFYTRYIGVYSYIHCVVCGCVYAPVYIRTSRRPYTTPCPSRRRLLRCRPNVSRVLKKPIHADIII